MNSVEVKDLHKIFKLPHDKHSSLKQAALNWRRRSYEIQKVLDGVSFEIKKGEFFGITGRNGSGKSTLLKILAGIYTPTSGTVHINGKLTPFIELGVGFNPELTGKDNVYLNGAIFGLSKRQVDRVYDEIVEFAELEKFMDQKLKNYSSGMQVRLAFSIAIQAHSDILLLDEVLAVGDEAFQRKCMSVFEKYKARKQTVIIVTHNMAIVEELCTRAMFIEKGKVSKIGDPAMVARMYSQSNQESYSQGKIHEDQKKSNSAFRVQILDPSTKKPRNRFKQNETILVRISWQRSDVQHTGVAIVKQSGEYIFGPNTFRDGFKLPPGSREVYYAAKLDFAPGEYYLKAGLFGSTDSKVLNFLENGPSFIVDAPAKKDVPEGILNLPHAWGNEDISLSS